MVSSQTPASISSTADFAWERALETSTLLDPYALTAEVLARCPPVFLSKSSLPGLDGRTWIATRFEPIREILQNNSRYSTAGLYPYFRLLGENLRAIPLQLDPPEHTLYRKFLEPSFSPRAIMAAEPQIRAVVGRLIDGFVERGYCDAAYEFSRLYPVKVFMQLMGFPEGKCEDFLSWAHPMHFDYHNRERVAWGARNALAYMRTFIAEVRDSPSNDTIASRIVHGQIEGRALTEDEIVGMVFFLWDGGMDTVAATSSLIFRMLALNPALQQQLRNCGERMAPAIEEFVRMNPTVNTARYAKIDHELAGMPITAGDRLFCLIASGNFDPAKFDDPRTYRIGRAPNPHLTFIAGAHHCLGMHLARFEMQIAFTEFMRRIPSFSLRPGSECVATPGLQGAPSVPIVWQV